MLQKTCIRQKILGRCGCRAILSGRRLQSLENPAGGLGRKKAQCWLEKALWIGVLSREDPTQPSIGWELGLDQGTALYWMWVVVLVAQSCLTQQPHRP